MARKRRKIGRPRKVGRPRRRISTRGTAALRRLYLQNLKSRGRHRNVRRRRRRNSWFGERAAHARASRFGWRRRRRAYVRRGGRRRLYYNSMGRRYKRAYRRVIKGRRRKTFDVWRNRRRNFGMDTVKQLLLGAAGFIGAALLISKIPQNIKDKIKIAGMDLAPAVIPLVAGVGLMYLAPKVKFLSKYSGVVNAIAFGLALSGGVFLVKEGIKKASPELAGKLGVAGWIETPFSTRGYVPGTRGYVPRLGEYLPRGLGAVNQMPSIPGIDRSLAIPGNRAMSEVPYGTGLPKTVRDYNRFAWSGVYDASTYE